MANNIYDRVDEERRNRVFYVYALQHNITKKIYVGSTDNLHDRYKGHIYALKKNNHPSKDMQEDFNKYGDDFSVFILEEVKDADIVTYDYGKRSIKRIIEREYYWMEKYDTIHTGYNRQDKQAKKFIEKDYIYVLPLKEGLPEMKGDADGDS